MDKDREAGSFSPALTRHARSLGALPTARLCAERRQAMRLVAQRRGAVEEARAALQEAETFAEVYTAELVTRADEGDERAGFEVAPELAERDARAKAEALQEAEAALREARAAGLKPKPRT